ncbi:YqgE/AlgH family protein [Marivirga atlantica]|jgi:putative transcriptional regulator|uniref:YqgE/AlgH family protein n=1 Tax=Marivirga atlantica TaxID=1548457 RepID=A0A937DL67_9BACT|nr:YqgE/AlgH family protein [Marivirga atlantica]MBL0766956.1 YqgE/AlgH family protein [Marivirga atlantica]
MEFFQYKNIDTPAKGDLLISEPLLPDNNFDRTVILLCEHNEEGSFGFVLNKLSMLNVDEVLDEVESFKTNLYVGGPVQQNTLHFIHDIEPLYQSGQLIQEGLCWGGDFDLLISLLKANAIDQNKIRFFVGYSGWSEFQLQQEIDENTWIVARGVHPSYIFNTDPDKLWKDTLEKMGGRFKVYANYPTDPKLN